MVSLESYKEKVGRFVKGRGRSESKVPLMLGLAAASAFTTLIFEPSRGRKRRAVLLDKTRSLGMAVVDAMQGLLHDFAHRLYGLYAEVVSSLREEEVTDQVLVERVRSRLGRVVSNSGALEVDVEAGQVFLRGQILRSEHRRAVRAARRVRGVSDIIDQLEVEEERGKVSSLQGRAAASNHNLTMNLPQATSHPVILAGASAGLFALSFRQKPSAKWSLIGIGAIALVQAIRNINRSPSALVPALLRRPHGRIDYEKTVEIMRPLSEVYDFWSHFENFPRFMTHLREVRDIGGGRSNWVAVGPIGMPAEWRAIITDRVPNSILAWKSEGGSLVPNFGIVGFEPTEGGTRVKVRLSYNPPAGRLGDTFLSLFGSNPKQMMDGDLMRLKSLLESGETTARGEKVHLSQMH